jgi:predicted metal-binding membrane protein
MVLFFAGSVMNLYQIVGLALYALVENNTSIGTIISKIAVIILIITGT